MKVLGRSEASGAEIMLFGTRESFAIEAMSEPGLKPPSAVWGRMRVWCEGEGIGDYAEPSCALYPAYCGFKRLVDTLPNLWSPELDGLSDVQLWSHFDGLLYGYHEGTPLLDVRSVEQCERDARNWGGYNFLTNWGEQFDNGGKSFILCRPNGVVRVLNRSLSAERGIARHAPLHLVLSAMQQYVEWFGEEAERLSIRADA